MKLPTVLGKIAACAGCIVLQVERTDLSHRITSHVIPGLIPAISSGLVFLLT